ncbi:MAG: class IV adenylate cyclase [Candidatus Altiarchaeota archaeon]|nr:class IV adenylate cyclase [Candidatus Altiarchaeota archaeon]
MDEFEVKILGIDRKVVEDKLVSLGARKVFDGVVHALFLDHCDGRIGKAGDVLRLRKVGDRSFLTYKRFVSHDSVKVREEHEVEVSDHDEAKSILEALDFTVSLEMRKQRTSYEISGVRFELDRYVDQYSFVPEFLEIEAKDEDTLYRYAELLGFRRGDCRPWTIIEIAEYYSTL